MALSPSQVAIVKSTAPIVKQHGQTVTTAFYRNLLACHPDLKSYFSLRNQQTGAQQAALASAVLAAAAHIDDLGRLAPAVERIAHKHASLFVRPEHYPVVGEFLVGAFAEVLGEEVFTPEVRDAWVAAYGLLAGVFIRRERQLYDEAGEWQDWRDFAITRREPEADGVVSFYLEPSDGRPLPRFLPGQYVSVQIPIAELDGLVQSRQFSLSLAPHEGLDHYRITVKKEKAGGGGQEEGSQRPSVEDLAAGRVAGLVSQRLHEQYRVGDKVQLSPPHGEFVLDVSSSSSTSPVILLSAGVGATPLISILDTVLSTPGQSRRPVTWIHAARHSGAMCYSKHIRSAASQHDNLTAKIFAKNVCEGDRPGVEYDYEGRLSLDTLAEENVLPLGDDSAEYYICGPEEWMVQVRAELEKKGVGRGRQHLELFRTGDV